MFFVVAVFLSLPSCTQTKRHCVRFENVTIFWSCCVKITPRGEKILQLTLVHFACVFTLHTLLPIVVVHFLLLCLLLLHVFHCCVHCCCIFFIVTFIDCILFDCVCCCCIFFIVVFIVVTFFVVVLATCNVYHAKSCHTFTTDMTSHDTGD